MLVLLDALCCGLGLVALLCASQRQWLLATLAAGAASLVRPQGLFFFFPLLAAAYDGPRHQWRVALMALIPCTIAVATLTRVTDELPFGAAFGVRPLDEEISAHGLNIWWLVATGFHLVDYDALAPMTPLTAMTETAFAVRTGVLARPLTTLALLVVAVWLGKRVRGETSLARLAAYTALIVHIYLVISVGVHASHTIYAIALLATVAYFDRRYRDLLIMFTALAALNLTIFQGLWGAEPTSRVGWFLPMTVVLSLLNVLLLVQNARLFAAFGEPATPVSSPRVGVRS